LAALAARTSRLGLVDMVGPATASLLQELAGAALLTTALPCFAIGTEIAWRRFGPWTRFRADIQRDAWARKGAGHGHECTASGRGR
jgi:hypothetical protein